MLIWHVCVQTQLFTNSWCPLTPPKAHFLQLSKLAGWQLVLGQGVALAGNCWLLLPSVQEHKKTTEAHEALAVGLACSAPKQKDIDHDMARTLLQTWDRWGDSDGAH